MNNLLIGQQLLQRLDAGSQTNITHINSPPTSSHDDRLSLKRRSIGTPPSIADTSQNHSMALYLRSPKLNRYLHLPRPYPDRPLHVSLAEVGSPIGAPVLIFLGIGCARYLIALFDELAKALKLRLICIDRWGYGKTDPVAPERGSPLYWAQVVEKVLDELKIKNFRMIAHSAGAPYAAAVALRFGREGERKITVSSPLGQSGNRWR